MIGEACALSPVSLIPSRQVTVRTLCFSRAVWPPQDFSRNKAELAMGPDLCVGLCILSASRPSLLRTNYSSQ